MYNYVTLWLPEDAKSDVRAVQNIAIVGGNSIWCFDENHRTAHAAVTKVAGHNKVVWLY